MTHLDQIIDFPDEVINKLCLSQNILNLLADKQNAAIEDIEDDDGYLKYIYDYEYVMETVINAKAYICIETLARASSGTINDMKLYIHILCHKEFMRLDKKIFKGIKGNRRDNLVREIDQVLRGDRDFGIGRVEFEQLSSFTLPPNFTGRTIVYDIPVFSRKPIGR